MIAIHDSEKDHRPHRRLYGRRQGHKLRAYQARLVDELLPRLSAPLEGESVVPADIFPAAHQVWLEIGFGAGEHLLWQAKHHPEVGLIGCEPYLNGVAKALAAIDRAGLGNIRLLMGDARDLLDRLVEESLDRAFLLFPDPWPKKRHHKRRFISPETVDRLAAVLKDGARFRVATDIPDYTCWTLKHLHRHPDFEWEAACPQDWRRRPADWPPTRYEQKALAAGRSPVYLSFRRRQRRR